MSRKQVVSIDLLNSSDTSISPAMATNITSREINVRELDKAIIHCSWAAGPEGEFQIEAQAHDKDDWFEINASAAWAVTGSDDSAQIVLTELPFTKIRLKWIADSGSANLSAFITLKSVGG